MAIQWQQIQINRARTSLNCGGKGILQVWFCRWLEIYRNTSRYSSKNGTGKVFCWKRVFLGEEELVPEVLVISEAESSAAAVNSRVNQQQFQ